VHRLQHDKLGRVCLQIRAGRLVGEPLFGTRGETAEPADAETSIAVLPFSDMSKEKDQDYFCEGIAEEIIGALSRIEGLAGGVANFVFPVQDRIGRRRRGGPQVTCPDAARRQRSQGRGPAADRRPAHGHCQRIPGVAERYDREVKDVFAIQEEIANSVAGSLELTLSPREKAALKKVPTENMQAYDCYLRGRKYYAGYGRATSNAPSSCSRRRRCTTPDTRWAYAGLADCWSYIYLYSNRSDTVREQADWASARAIELDPNSAQAHASRALALSLSRSEKEAKTSSRRHPSGSEPVRGL